MHFECLTRDIREVRMYFLSTFVIALIKVVMSYLNNDYFQTVRNYSTHRNCSMGPHKELAAKDSVNIPL